MKNVRNFSNKPTPLPITPTHVQYPCHFNVLFQTQSTRTRTRGVPDAIIVNVCYSSYPINHHHLNNINNNNTDSLVESILTA